MKIPTLDAEIFCPIECDDRVLQRQSHRMRRQINAAALIPGNNKNAKPALPWRGSAGLLLMAFLLFWRGLIPRAGTQCQWEARPSRLVGVCPDDETSTARVAGDTPGTQ